jgi:hypothetical protein
MSDVLKVIADLKARLWAEFGDVLKSPNTQDETHMTYYLGDLLQRNGHPHSRHVGGTYYTEAATQAAFIAGMRIGRRDAVSCADDIVDARMAAAIRALKGEDNE